MARGALGQTAGGKAYLFAYNMIQFFGWSYGFYLFLTHVNGKGTCLGSWQTISCVLTFFQTLQFLEVIHCVVGLVPSSAIQTAMQIASRLVVVWGILRQVPESQESFGLPLLMTAWSIADATRYLYYAFHLYDMVPYVLTWVRYSFFIILYPVGVTGELTTIIQALPYIIKRNLFAIPLPNPLNISFYYQYLLYAIMASYLPFFPQLYGYMLSQRKKFLGGSPDSGKKSK